MWIVIVCRHVICVVYVIMLLDFFILLLYIPRIYKNLFLHPIVSIILVLHFYFIKIILLKYCSFIE